MEPNLQDRREAGADPSDDRSPGRRRGTLGILLHGASWNTAAQLTPVAVNLALTPYVIHGLGVVQYGLYALAATVTMFISALNGGIGSAAPRFFAVYAGRGDRAAATRLLVTLVVTVAVGGAALSLGDWFASPLIARALHMPVRYRGGSIFLLRTFGVLVTVSMIHQLFVSLLRAHQRYSLTSKTVMASYLGWAGGLYLSVRLGAGLEGVACSLIAEQVVATAIILPAAAGYLDLRAAGFVSRRVAREFFSFSTKTQLVGLNALFMLEFDALVIGVALSVRDVGLYNAGANVAGQLLTVTLAAVPPIGTYLAAVFGRDGEAAAEREMARIQRIWVIATSGWSAAALGSVYFGVVAWLGPAFRLSAVVCVVLVAGYSVASVAAVLPAHAAAVGKPTVQVRYGAVALGANLLVTAPLILLGVVGVVAATTVGNVVGCLYLIHLARRHLSPDVANFFAEVPVLRTLGCAAATVGMELVLAPWVPQGPAGLVACGAPALVALGGYGLSFLGPRRAVAIGRALLRGRGLPEVLVG